MKKFFLTTLTILFSVLTFAQGFTLQQCIDSALVNNNQVKQRNYQYETQKIQYNQARQNLLPNLNASAGQSWGFGRSIGADNVYKSTNSTQTNFGLSTNLSVFDGLRMKYNIDEAKATMLASEANIEALKADIMMNISAMYLQVLLNKEICMIAEQQLAETHLKIERSKALVAANRLAEGELYTMQAQEAKESLSLVQAKNNLQLSLLDLAQAMELEMFDGFDVAIPNQEELMETLLPNNNQVYQDAVLNRAEIKVAEYNLQASELALKTAKAAYSPSISAGANIGTSFYNLKGYPNNDFGQQLGDNLATSVGINMSVPIFNKMQVNNNVKRAKISIENSKVEVDNIKKNLRKNIDQAYYNALAAKMREEAAEKTVKSSQEAFRYTEQKYEAGRASVYELNDSKLNYTLALSERIQAKYDYLFKLKILEYYAGF